MDGSPEDLLSSFAPWLSFRVSQDERALVITSARLPRIALVLGLLGGLALIPPFLQLGSLLLGLTVIAAWSYGLRVCSERMGGETVATLRQSLRVRHEAGGYREDAKQLFVDGAKVPRSDVVRVCLVEPTKSPVYRVYLVLRDRAVFLRQSNRRPAAMALATWVSEAIGEPVEVRLDHDTQGGIGVLGVLAMVGTMFFSALAVPLGVAWVLSEVDAPGRAEIVLAFFAALLLMTGTFVVGTLVVRVLARNGTKALHARLLQDSGSR